MSGLTFASRIKTIYGKRREVAVKCSRRSLRGDMRVAVYLAVFALGQVGKLFAVPRAIT
jgi:hypothetical protein